MADSGTDSTMVRMTARRKAYEEMFGVPLESHVLTIDEMWEQEKDRIQKERHQHEADLRAIDDAGSAGKEGFVAVRPSQGGVASIPPVQYSGGNLKYGYIDRSRSEAERKAREAEDIAKGEWRFNNYEQIELNRRQRYAQKQALREEMAAMDARDQARGGVKKGNQARGGVKKGEPVRGYSVYAFNSDTDEAVHTRKWQQLDDKDKKSYQIQQDDRRVAFVTADGGSRRLLKGIGKRMLARAARDRDDAIFERDLEEISNDKPLIDKQYNEMTPSEKLLHDKALTRSYRDPNFKGKEGSPGFTPGEVTDWKKQVKALKLGASGDHRRDRSVLDSTD